MVISAYSWVSSRLWHRGVDRSITGAPCPIYGACQHPANIATTIPGGPTGSCQLIARFPWLAPYLAGAASPACALYSTEEGELGELVDYVYYRATATPYSVSHSNAKLF